MTQQPPQMPFDINQLNSLISQASDSILCNSDCQRSRKAERLQQKLMEAQIQLETAPEDVKRAEKKYITYTRGTAVYNELMDIQYGEKADGIIETFLEKFQQEVAKIHAQIESYAGLVMNVENVQELYEKYKRENAELWKGLKEDTSDTLTNERKTYYEDQNIDRLNGFYFWLKLVYAICLIVYVVLNFLFPSERSFAVRLITSVALFLLPFLSTYLLLGVYYILKKVYSILPTMK
jgi:hypothetical protein